jgi:hypothetical protein
MCEDTWGSFLKSIVKLYLAVFASPDKIGLTSAATYLIVFLIEKCELLRTHLRRGKVKLTKRFTPI